MAVDTEDRVDPETVDDDEDFEGDGRSIEDRAREGEHEEEEDDGQFLIPGTKPGLTTAAGGRKPDFSEAKLDSISLRLAGEFKKGDRVRLLVDAVVRDVGFPDTYDKNGHITSTTRRHTFKPLAVEPVEIPPGD